MQLRLEQLDTHLGRGLRALYTVHGDEPLLVQEACDALRAAARARGCTEREVFNVSGAHFDWSAVLGATRAMSLFASERLVELRIPSGKPGKEGSLALQQLAEAVPDGVFVLVVLPALDNTALRSGWFTALEAAGVALRVEGVERSALPAWIAQRLARQGQRVREGEEGQRTLGFFADRVEGNLLAAHQEIGKLALLHPPGELGLEDVEAAVLDVARYDVRRWCEAVLEGHAGRALRMLEGLRAEGESPVSVLWKLADDLRALHRVRAALDAGRPLPLALQEARVWGPRQRVLERAAPRCGRASLARLVAAASTCDGITKGLPRPQWPADPWDALRHLVGLTIRARAGAGRAARAPLSSPGGVPPDGARARRAPGG
ncbi:MAG: DNA polymerase III subunit delta [Rubrivivax sp.]